MKLNQIEYLLFEHLVVNQDVHHLVRLIVYYHQERNLNFQPIQDQHHHQI